MLIKIKFLFFIFTVFFSNNAISESLCTKLFDENKFGEALQPCLEENDNFRLGYIYAQKNNCSKSQEYYKKNGSSTAYMNMAVRFIYATAGCSKDLKLAEDYLNISINKDKNSGNFHTFGDLEMMKAGVNPERYFDKPNYEAFKYYVQSINYFPSSDWDNKRKSESLEKVKDYIYLSDASKGLNYLLEISLEKKPSEEVSKLIEENENYFFNSDKDIIKDFTKYVELYFSSEDNIYLKGKMFELGVGHIENYEEAYRIYLIASSEGSVKARKAKEKIRDKLTQDQIKKATCLAEKGLNPSWMQKQLCKW